MISSDQRPPGEDWLVRRMVDLERQVRELQAGRRLEAATIGAGGLTIKGGSIRVLDGSGGSVELGGGQLIVKDSAGNVVQRLGRLTDGKYALQSSDSTGAEVLRIGQFLDDRYGLRAPNASGGSVELAQDAVRVRDNSANAIVELGKAVDSRYGLRVNNAAGAPQIRSGELASAGNYGLEAVDSGGALVDLGRLVFSIQAATVPDFESTNSTLYTNLFTVGPEVTVIVGPTGRVEVTLSAIVSYSAGGGDTTGGGSMSFRVDDGATLAESDTRALYTLINDSNATAAGYDIGASRTILVTGLPAGPRKFTARYRSQHNVNSCGWQDRHILVKPL